MEQGRGVFRTLARATAVADRRVTGLSREVLAELVAELGPRWQARQDARLADRPRRRAVGAGARHRLVFLDRLLATLVHLRHGVTGDVLACWFGVSRSTITRAVSEVRLLLAKRGCPAVGAGRWAAIGRQCWCCAGFSTGPGWPSWPPSTGSAAPRPTGICTRASTSWPQPHPGCAARCWPRVPPAIRM